MKKQILKSALIAVTGVGLMAGGALADPLNDRTPQIQVNAPYGTEPSLQSLIDITTNGVNVIDAVGDQSSAALWTQNDFGGATTVFEVAYFTDGGGAIGIYDTNGNRFLLPGFTNPNLSNPAGYLSNVGAFTFTIANGQLLDGNFNPVDNETDWASTFGFYWERQGQTVYTEDSLNNGAFALSYIIPTGTTVNLQNFGSILPPATVTGNDDWIIAFDNITGSGDFNDAFIVVKDMNMVPEPTTMLLFGTGLIGLAAIGRRRINS